MKCQQAVFGASQACQAMGSLYHNSCFTCSACSKSTRTSRSLTSITRLIAGVTSRESLLQSECLHLSHSGGKFHSCGGVCSAKSESQINAVHICVVFNNKCFIAPDWRVHFLIQLLCGDWVCQSLLQPSHTHTIIITTNIITIISSLLQFTCQSGK